MGTQLPWSLFQKRSVFHVCFNIICILFFIYYYVAQHLGIYGDLCTEETPYICIFPSLTFFGPKRSSWKGSWAIWGFWFQKFALYGDSATMVPCEKRSVYHVRFNIIHFLFVC